jgi:ADP-heptose:LPS heptosyltransferase
LRRILVFSMTRMGDIIQSIPFIRRLRKQNPDAQIDLLVEKCFADVAAFLPGIDRIIEIRLEDLLLCFDENRGPDLPQGVAYYCDLVNSLRDYNYDEVWNLTHTKPFTVLSSLVGGAEARGVTIDDHGLQRVNAPWLKYFYATNLTRPWCQFNLVDIYANCIGGVPKDFGRSVQIDPQIYQEREPEGYRATINKRRVAIHPGASQAAKQWPVDSFAQVAKQLTRRDVEIVLIGGRSDLRLGDAFENDGNTINLIGKTSVHELAAVLADCDLLISNDSGPMHVAAAVDTKVIAITIGSALGSETAPYGEGHWVIEPRVECFPCSAQDTCSGRHCAALVKVEHITELAMACLTEAGLSDAISNDPLIRLYRTTFNSGDGQLDLIRFGNHNDDSRDQLNSMLRSLWPIWLDNAESIPMGISNPDSLVSKSISEARRFAMQAKKLCDEIAASDSNSSKGIAKITKASETLAETDAKLSRALSSNKALKSILAYLMIEKGSVGGDTLYEQARATAEVYAGLVRMLSSVADPAFSRTNKRSNICIEVCHENLA